jgi:phosphoribosyl 1,2-cyclic phosphodiesterase
VRVTFHGVRGSTPQSGAGYERTGGHTSNIAISAGDGDGASGELPTLLLDAGTGLLSLTRTFAGAPFCGTILLTHLHWDHLQGLPFFPPGDRDDARVTVMQPAQGDPIAVLSRAMSPPHFPIGPNGLRGTWAHLPLEPGEHEIEGFSVTAAEIPHKGGRTYGYRVAALHGGGTFAYMPDHCPTSIGPGPDGLGARHENAMALAWGVDVLVHGAPFVVAEIERATLFGHSTAEYAVGLANDAGVGRLILTHHAPFRDDDAVEAIAEGHSSSELSVVAAKEGDSFTL